ncbi:HutD family protein [Streptococcus jiangjianxini]|uniref:HutD family protein n=1 Tax=Streptococcus jiangjianxini TaxID=3161189 RepID=UPI0032EAD450
MTIVTVRKPSDYILSDWSGGKTQQLYLYPETGDYGKKQFSYRLSTATVAIRQTTFTSLEGYHRLIMTLDKPITLSDIDDNSETTVVPFQPYAFEGNSRIISHGTCQDMNLIFDDHYQGQLQAIWPDSKDNPKRADVEMIYALTDLTIYWNNQEKLTLAEGHLAVMEMDSSIVDVQVHPTKHQENHRPLAIWAGLWKKGSISCR